MKTLAVFCLITSLLCTQDLQANEIPADARLSQAQVYLRGAQVFHTTKLRVPTGTHVIVFDSVSSQLNVNTLRTSLLGPATFVSMSHRQDAKAQDAPDVLRRVKLLQDSLQELMFKMQDHQAEKSVIEEEYNYVTSQLSAPRKDSLALDIAKVEQTANFIGKSLGSLKQRALDVQRKITALNVQTNALQDTIRTLQMPQARNQVLVTLFMENSAEVEIGVSYMLPNAGWSPAYDVRVPAVGEAMQLKYKAIVWQQSDVEWKDVKISVSNRNPGENSNHPVVNPWLIDFQTADDGGNGFAIRGSQTFDLHANSVRASTDRMVWQTLPDVNFAGGAQQIVEFSSPQATSIPRDGKHHMVALTSHEFTPLYEYYAVPKLDPNAFLLARITEWSKYNLLPGDVNIYFRDNFVGTTTLNPYSITDTISLSLGRDRNVVVKRNSSNTVEENSFLGNDIERFYAYNIFVRNTYAQAITLTLEEPVPKSGNQDIDVDIDEMDGAEFHKQKNSVRWRMELAAQQSIEKKVNYSVTYPADRQISGL